MRRVLALLSLILILVAAGAGPLVGAAPAHAHASVSGTEPRADSTVSELPRRIIVRVVKKQATRAGDPLQVFAPDGTRIDTGDVLIGEGGAAISVGLRPVTNAAGVYNVLYQITSADTHVIEDRFAFTLTPVGTQVLSPANGAGLRSGGTAQAPVPGRLRLTGPPAGSIAGVVVLLVALVVLVIMARRRRHRATEEAEQPGFRVISTGEHRLADIPPGSGPDARWGPAATPTGWDHTAEWADAEAGQWDGSGEWDGSGQWDEPQPGWAPARADWGPVNPGYPAAGPRTRSVS